MEIIINGNKEKIADGIYLHTLLEMRGVNPNVVACELNLTIIRRAKLSETALKEGDVLEIIQMVGGGSFDDRT